MPSRLVSRHVVPQSQPVHHHQPAQGVPSAPALAPPRSSPVRTTVIQPALVHNVPANQDVAAPTILTATEDPYEDARPLTLATPQPNDDPLPRSWYPKPWQEFIDHAQGYILKYMACIYPFPNGVCSQLTARENVATAFGTFRLVSDHNLDRDSCKLTYPPPSPMSCIQIDIPCQSTSTA